MSINTAVHLLLQDQWSPQQDSLEPSGFERFISNLAFHAMMVEVNLTPKPGLVDTVNNGAHQDMNLALFEQSAAAITPHLSECVSAGYRHRHIPAADLLKVLRPIGIQAEASMFCATNGVNTHKGMIFSLGIICGAIGWLKANGIAIDAVHISKTVQACTQHLLWTELKTITRHDHNTMGERLYLEHGITGARGEAASGFRTVMKHSLPVYQRYLGKGYSVEQALWQSLLVLMANNQDTNIIARGGLEGLNYVKGYASTLLEQGGIDHKQIEQQLITFDKELINKNLSPGGSADLLAVTWFLAELEMLLDVDVSMHEF